MGYITIDELSEELKAYLQNVGVSEEKIVELINTNIPQDVTNNISSMEVKLAEAESTINRMENIINNLQSKLIDVMIYINMSSGSEVDNVGYWYDDLSTGASVTFIEGLTLDTDRNRIFGAPGNVIFKELKAPFNSDQVKITLDFDNNFVESVSEFNANAGDTQISIDNYVYKVE